MDAIGARVTVTVGDMRMVRDISPVSGYLSQSDPRAHFGLRQSAKVDRVAIRWPNGKTTTMANVEANRFIEVMQSTSEAK